MLTKARNTFLEYPRTFWVLMGGTFIDGLGGAMLFPFFSLYVTQRFSVGLTEAGIVFAIFAAASVVGSMIGGAMTDKFGRKIMIMFGLTFSALSSLSMAFVDDLQLFYIIAAFVGLLGNTGGAAQQAMVADLLPEEQLTEGYGIQRVVQNMTVAIGPAIGGFMAATSFILLFMFDALTSLITVAIVYYKLPETKPETPEGVEEESLGQSFGGYGKVLRDRVYMAFLLASIVMTMVYVQMNSTMPVYLRDVHGIPASGWGFMMSVNALMVVLFQFWITRRISNRPPFLMMAYGVVFYLIGFSMYGFVFGFPMFILAMIILTVGELIVTPVAQALVAKMSPEDMRGRYMAMFGFSWTIPFAIAPLLAGYVSDNFDPNWVWYASGFLSFVAILAYIGLHVRYGERFRETSEQTKPAPVAGD